MTDNTNITADLGAATTPTAQQWLLRVSACTALLMTLSFCVAHFSSDPSQQVLFDNVQWTVAQLGAAMLAWLGYRNAPAEELNSRRWFMWGLASYAFGQLLWDWQIFTGWSPIPAPSDLFYAACGPLIAWGVWAGLRQRVSVQRARVLLLDIAILLIQVLAVLLMIYLSNAPDASLTQLAQLAIYPIVMFGSVIIILVMALELGLSLDWRWMTLPGSLILFGICWMVWNLVDLNGTPANGTWLNYGFAIASLLSGIGTAHWQVLPAETRRSEQRGGVFVLLPIIMVSAAVGTLFMVWSQTSLPEPVRLAVLSGAGAVIVLAVIRQGLWLAERDRLLLIERQHLEHEQQYRVLAQRFELAAAVARIGIWDIDLVSRHVIWDRRMYEIYGHDPAADTSAYALWEQSVHPDDMQKVRDAIIQAARDAVEMNVEFRIITPEGELRYLEASGVAQYDTDNRPVRMAGINRDVTARVRARRALAESEAELHAIFENSAIGIILVDKDRRVLRRNHITKIMFGYTDEQVRQLRIDDLIHPDELEFSLKLFDSAVSGERSSYQAEKRYRRREGDYLWVRITVNSVMLNNDRYFVGLVEDISQRKQVEDELYAAQQKQLHAREEFAFHLLNAQEQERQRIANELHDSLGQSLSVIKNRAQLALEQSACLPAAEVQLQGILRVTTDAIAEVRGLAHNLRPLHLEQLGLSGALQQLLDQFSESSQLQLDVRLEPIDDAIPAAQVTHVYRLMQEALNNINRHAQATRVSVRVERDVHVVRIFIADNGCGFDTGTRSGNGLGLSSMTERAHMLGGSMKMSSAPGMGTELLIELPVMDHHTQDAVLLDEPL